MVEAIYKWGRDNPSRHFPSGTNAKKFALIFTFRLFTQGLPGVPGELERDDFVQGRYIIGLSDFL